MNRLEQIAREGNLLRRAAPKSVRPKPLLRKRRVRRVSKKRAVQKREYAKMLPGWIERHPVCEVCPIINAAGFSVKCRGATDHPHHVRGRRGALLTDERYFKACCGGESHPQWIHFTHKEDAIALGLLVQGALQNEL